MKQPAGGMAKRSSGCLAASEPALAHASMCWHVATSRHTPFLSHSRCTGKHYSIRSLWSQGASRDSQLRFHRQYWGPPGGKWRPGTAVHAGRLAGRDPDQSTTISHAQSLLGMQLHPHTPTPPPPHPGSTGCLAALCHNGRQALQDAMAESTQGQFPRRCLQWQCQISGDQSRTARVGFHQHS